MAMRTLSSGGMDRRRRPRRRLILTTVNILGLGALLAAPVAAVSLWLLITDPVVAGEATEGNSLLPVVRALVATVGRALAALLAYL
jgi:hypothetical protein